MTTTKRISLLFGRDFTWAELIAASVMIAWGASNWYAPSSPFKLQFLAPLLRIANEQTWNELFAFFGALQIAALVTDSRAGRYASAVVGCAMFGSLVCSMILANETYPARFILHSGGALINGFALYRHAQWLRPAWHRVKVGD